MFSCVLPLLFFCVLGSMGPCGNRVAPRLQREREMQRMYNFMEFMGSMAGQSRQSGTGRQSKGNGKGNCRACGKPGHVKRECSHRDSVCNRCSKHGHIAAACYQDAPASTPADTSTSQPQRTGGGEKPATGAKSNSTKTCLCCGKGGHVKADCKDKEKECSNCGKVGHLKSVCRKAAKGRDENASDSGTTAGGVTLVWQCQRAGCPTWHTSDKTTQCSKCGTARMLEPQTKKPAEVYNLGKEYEEYVQRLLAETAESEPHYQLPPEVVENNKKRAQLEELIQRQTELGLTASVKEAKDALGKLPKKVEAELQPHVDMTKLTKWQLDLRKYHGKRIAEFEDKEKKHIADGVWREEQLERDLKDAQAEYDARVKTIREQYRIHSEAAAAKRKENADRKQMHQDTFEQKMRDLQAGKVAATTAATGGDLGPTLPALPLQQVPAAMPVVTPAQVTKEAVTKSMLAKGMDPKQASIAADAALQYMNEVMVYVAPAPTALTAPPDGATPASGDAALAAVHDDEDMQGRGAKGARSSEEPLPLAKTAKHAAGTAANSSLVTA